MPQAPVGSSLLKPPALTGRHAKLQQSSPPMVQMDEDDIIPVDLMIAEENMETDEQAKLSKQKLVDTLSFSHPGGSFASVLANVSVGLHHLTSS